jgi:hypothetical protein
MILSFIEGSIIVKKPAVIQTGDNPFRQRQLTEYTEAKEQLLLTNEIYNGETDVQEEKNDDNNDNDTNNDDSSENESTILEFRNTDSELINEVTVDLDKSDTNTEKAMTMNSAEMDAFRRKYDELMKQLEKERFERELIARSR